MNPNNNGQGGDGQIPRRRFFTIQRDLILLRLAVQHNPWQLGTQVWVDIHREFEEQDGNHGFREQALKDRVRLLHIQYKKQCLVKSTGTELEKTERSELLAEVDNLMNLAKQPIQKVLGADDDGESSDDDTDDESGRGKATGSSGSSSGSSEPAEPIQSGSKAGTSSEPIVLGKKSKPGELMASAELTSKRNKPSKKDAERQEADDQRDEALLAMGAIGGKTPNRGTTRKFTEEDLLKAKTSHDMEMENKRLRVEEDQRIRDHGLEQKRIELEQKKLAVEADREKRLGEESRRRDEIMQHQVAFSQAMLQFFVNVGGVKPTFPTAIIGNAPSPGTNGNTTPPQRGPVPPEETGVDENEKGTSTPAEGAPAPEKPGVDEN